ncbi:penicillin acylase family protein [Sediminibacterium soli]|uniref:penicillin acylase family protein n=1 Tax=Sediminibacterium soli TaxID=2698829 RepID=UPI00137B8CA9|nr:penicillin acylase family protein [Sediminibacterium soli]NCI47104.1 penicillin acylase family protein [Sediminibacterium soli]
MRILPFLLSGLVTAALVLAFNTQLPVGSGKTPRLGYFLSPQVGFWQNAEPVNADFNGEVTLSGLAGKVDVYFDDRLVPHIYADNDKDAYYVQGFLHAKFRLWQMEFQTHVAAGRLSEIVGEERLSTDQFFRRLGMVYGAEQSLANAEKNPELKAGIEAYAKGVNAYIQSLRPEQLPFEYKLLDYTPETWTSLKTYLFMMYMSYDLAGRGAAVDLQMTNARNYFGFVDFDKLFSNTADSLDPIIPRGTVYAKPAIVPKEPTGSDSLYFNNKVNTATASAGVSMEPDKDNGSNNWAVAGSKTKSGRPILCNDPHLGLNLPSLWYEVQISTPTHNTYGVGFPGSPAVIIGFNDSIAWGVTNAGRDVLDYYEMQFRDSTMSEYWFNGAWVKAEHRKEVIRIKGKPDKVEEIAMTVFGPVMYDNKFSNPGTGGKYLAVRWTAHDKGNGLQTFYELDHAKNYDDYLSAINKWHCPGQNFVFASKSGDIAIKQQGGFVARWKRQGDFILPGTDSSYRWQGFIPSEENPMSRNPARGFVSSANQMPTDASYPYYLGAASNFPMYRGLAINRKLAAMNNITPEDMQHLQMDNENLFAEMAVPVLLKNIDRNALNADEKKYINLLAAWNHRGDTAEQGATVFKVLWDSLETVIWADEYNQNKLPMAWPEYSTLLESLLKDSVYAFSDDITTGDKTETIRDNVLLAVKKATLKLKELEGAGRLAWAKFKDTRVNHLLRLPALSRWHLPIGGGRDMINATKENHGPSWRMIVHMTDEIEAYCLYPGGQSGNPGSKYYDAFVTNWALGKYYRILFASKQSIATDKQVKWHMRFTNS